MRVLKHNTRWAAKLAKREERKRVREERIAAKQQAEIKLEAERARKERATNPFSMNSSSEAGLFGASLFDSAPEGAESTDDQGRVDRQQQQKTSEGNESEHEVSNDEDEDDYDDEERLAEEMSIKASLEEQHQHLQNHWSQHASHYTTPLYLNTIPEPENEPESEAQDQALQESALSTSHVPVIGSGEGEVYEQMKIDGLDHVFERFTRRLGSEARQVVRYEFGGVPIPFSGKGSLFKRLWPNGLHAGCDSSSVPACEYCGAPRVFELQLMPNLANLLRAEKLSDAAESNGENSSNQEAQRQAEIASLFGLESAVTNMRTGIAWSTAIVYVCSRDCCQNESEGYAEEWVGLQHETDV